MLFPSFILKSHTVYLARSTHMVRLVFHLKTRRFIHLFRRLVVRVRSREGRRNRAPPPRVRWKDGKKVNPAVAAAEDAKVAAAVAGKA